MNKLKLLPLLLAVSLLYGCASGAMSENMAYKDTTGLKFDKALNNEVALSEVNGGEETNPLWTSEISNEEFQQALKLSLSSQGLMSENGKYLLKVKLTKVEQPLFGLDLEVTTHVNYVLTDARTGKKVLDEEIVAPYTATMGDAFVGMVRLRLANEGSGRANIKGFLEKLSKLNIAPGSVALSK